MTHYCVQCKITFEVAADELSYLKRVAFRFGDAAFEFPPPAECPECRLQIRTSHRNEQHLYAGVSSLSGDRIISLYADQAPLGPPYLVYNSEEWHSDSWDALTYGRAFNFGRSFFEQFADLQKSVPRLGLVTLNNENCPYTTGTAYCRNCHLISCSENCENCYYGKLLQHCRDCVDCSYIYNSELCYECFSVYDCYDCKYLSYAKNCANCWFSENLIGCHNCLFCTNLQRQTDCIFNKPVSADEFKSAVSALGGSSARFADAKNTWLGLRRQRIHRYANITNSENCSGDFITNSKNCLDCFDVSDSEDCRYVCVGVNVKDMYDCSNVYLKQELCYQMMGTIGTYHCAFSTYAFHCHDVIYSDHVFDSANLFGCVGLRRKSYCIFNRQYSEPDYHALAAKIIRHMQETGEWGKFFPPRLSPFGYNESLAFDYLPLSQEQVEERGWHWREQPALERKIKQYPAFPDRIADVDDDICRLTFLCGESGREFKIIPQELKFYRRNELPLPHRSPLQRHFDREKLRNKRQVWQRFCERCGASLRSNFDPQSPEIVYCEECFEQLVY